MTAAATTPTHAPTPDPTPDPVTGATFVIGASGDLGRAIAERAIAAGRPVGLTYHRNPGPVQELARTAAAAGGTSGHVQCDSRRPDQVRDAYRRLVEELGVPRALVYCAGTRRDRPFLQMPEQDWDDVLATNLGGAMSFVRAAATDMVKARAGTIVLISSVSGQIGGVAGQTNYGASKGALGAVIRSLARELGPFGVTINGVAPGLVDSTMTADLTPAVTRAYLSRIPLRRLATPQDIAPTVEFLTSPGSGYITGQTVVVDGGLTA